MLSSGPTSSPTGYETFSFTNTYQTSELLGKGAYGHVFKGTAPNGTTVALKEIVLKTKNEGIPLSTLRELSVLKKVQSFNCAHLVQMLDISLTKKDNLLCIYIVFEFIECDLATFLSQHVPPTGLSPDTIRDLSEQLLRGTEFLHSHRIIHRDLKPANILIDREGRQLKITDFGLSRILGWESTLTPIVVTLWYRSPEILLQSEYLSPCDIWAAGCIIAELFNRSALFRASTDLNLLGCIFNVIGFPDPCDWPSESFLKRSDFKVLPKQSKLRSVIQTTDTAALDLLEKMLQFNPRKRITASDALLLPYFHPRPSTFPGLPFHSQNQMHLSSTVCRFPPSAIIRPLHRHSTIPLQANARAVCNSDSTIAHSVVHVPPSQKCQQPLRVYRRDFSTSITGLNIQTDSVHSMNTLPVSTRSYQDSEFQTTVPRSTISETEEHQHNLMISILKHAIDDTSTPSPPRQQPADTVGFISGTPPHRPVTRQQTRAARRYTQPTIPLSVIFTDSTEKRVDVCESKKASKSLCPSSANQTGAARPSSGRMSENSITSVRPRRTARRRTIVGSTRSAQKDTTKSPSTCLPSAKPTRPSTSGQCADGGFVNSVGTSLLARSDSVGSSISLNHSSSSYPYEQQPPQHYHRRLTKLPEKHHSRQSQHNSRPTHLNQSVSYQPHRQHCSSRYSFDPNMLSSRVLAPIAEQFASTYSNSPTREQTESFERTQFECPPNSENLAVQMQEGVVENLLCSPSKQPRVLVSSAQLSGPPRLRNMPSDLSVLTDHSDHSALLDDDELVPGAATDTEDSDCQVANTSLGINSAMTGLALVNRMSSLTASSNQSDANS